MSQPDNSGAMANGRTKISHKCLGAKGNRTSCNILHIKGKGCNISSHLHEQHDSPVILNENGDIKKQELTAISKEISQYLLKRKITITAKYLPGSVNMEAARESRQTRDSSEWKLNSTIFMKLCQLRGTAEMDMFVLRASHQLAQYIF